MALPAKKILFLFTRPPYPANDGTKIKIISNILDVVKAPGGYECTIAIISDVPPDPLAVAYLEKHYGRVRYFYESRLRRAWRGIGGWLLGCPLQVGYFFSHSTAEALSKDFNAADVIYAHTLRFGKYIERLPVTTQKKVVLDFNDAISFNYHTARQYAHGAWRYIYALEESRLRHYEEKLLTYPFHFSIVSVADHDYLSALAEKAGIKHGAIDVIEHGVVDDLLNYSNDYKGALNIIFMGNMVYPPNLDSIKWLGGFIGRHAFKNVSGSVVDAVGRTPKGFSEQLPGIAFAGFVDDPHAFILQHKVFVAPLRFGAGVQTKVLEAMALGMPVVTSPIGARGIGGAKSGENIFIVDMADEAAWQNTIEKLFADEAFRARVGAAARALIIERYTASGARKKFAELFERVAAIGGTAE